jgi:hypothetical protein
MVISCHGLFDIVFGFTQPPSFSFIILLLLASSFKTSFKLASRYRFASQELYFNIPTIFDEPLVRVFVFRQHKLINKA